MARREWEWRVKAEIPTRLLQKKKGEKGE